MKTNRKIIETIGQVQVMVVALAEQGVRGFDCREDRLSALADWGREPPGHQTESLVDIRRHLGECTRCKLCEGRTHIVFGAGNPNAKLVFIGEGPGRDEDLQGEPFVGAAGQLLTKIIAAIGLTREEVYICNIIKCRPPRNRNPLPDEIAACAPFLYRQLQSIKPLFVCALGKFAAQTLLETDRPISRLRGRFHEVEGLRILPTYHPAYLLRNPEQKRAVWEDMKLLMKEYPYDKPQK
jgi:DNA polymerase